MSRPPQDRVSQRTLVYQLATVVDGLMFGGGLSAVWDRRLKALLEENPRSAHSTHVSHNIGIRRLRFLRTYLATRGDHTAAMSAAFRRTGSNSNSST